MYRKKHRNNLRCIVGMWLVRSKKGEVRRVQGRISEIAEGEKQQIFENLLIYCEVDSRVMVELAGTLRALG